MMINYKEIFNALEKTLQEQSIFSMDDFKRVYDPFKAFENRKRTDEEIFSILTLITFYSGFSASKVEKKEQIILRHIPSYQAVSEYSESHLQEMLSDKDMIKHVRKIRGCINNAKTFKHIVKTHGSFQNYIDSFDANSSFENLILLKEELEYHFDYLGGTTVYHFLTELGYNVLKPDRVILRIFKRLGLIENERQYLKTIIQGRKFAKETELPIRYIDIVLVKYGQEGKSLMFGTENGICLEEKPNCSVCGATQYCEYFQKLKTYENLATNGRAI